MAATGHHETRSRRPSCFSSSHFFQTRFSRQDEEEQKTSLRETQHKGITAHTYTAAAAALRPAVLSFPWLDCPFSWSSSVPQQRRFTQRTLCSSLTSPSPSRRGLFSRSLQNVIVFSFGLLAYLALDPDSFTTAVYLKSGSSSIVSLPSFTCCSLFSLLSSFLFFAF